MKEFLATKAMPILLAIAFVIVGSFSIGQTISKKKLEQKLLLAQNDLAEAVGTIELGEGVYARLATRHSDLNRAYNDLLGENEMLSDSIARKEEEIRTLVQANATLREEIEFAGNATVTVISGCDEGPVGEGDTSTGEPIEEDEFIPNLRVDFDLEEGGFRVQGHTESNPSLMLGPPVGSASLTLTQISPFVVDIAVTQNEDNDWRAIVYEQEGRLQFDIGVLAVNPMSSRIRWYERIGIGTQVVAAGDGFGLAPVIGARLGSRGAWDVSVGPYWSYGQGGAQRGATMGVTVYPFSRRRDK